jgi:hypothetical protein
MIDESRHHRPLAGAPAVVDGEVERMRSVRH